MRHIQHDDVTGWRDRTYFVSDERVERERAADDSRTTSAIVQTALCDETWRWRDAHAPLTNRRRLDAWLLRYYGVEGQESTAAAARFAFGRTAPTLMLTHGNRTGRALL